MQQHGEHPVPRRNEESLSLTWWCQQEQKDWKNPHPEAESVLGHRGIKCTPELLYH